MADYDLTYGLAPGWKPRETAPDTDEATPTVDPAVVAKAVEHRRPDAIGTSGVAHLQRAAGNAATAQFLGQHDNNEDDPSLVHDVVNSSAGSSLDDATRSSMETKFGHDFSSVRVHSGGQAAAAAKSVQAQAFTVGDDIVLGAGKNTSDTRTLAHELTHVVQQRQGEVPGEPIGNGLKVSDPGDWAEQEAEQTADDVVQTLAVQRDEGDGEDEEEIEPESEVTAPEDVLEEDEAAAAV